MNERDKPTDDQALSAYLDGELPPGETDRLTERLAAEPALARRLENLRAADAATRQAFHAIDKLPLPQGVLNLLDTDAETRGNERTGNVIPFRQRVARSFLQAPVAIAASVALAAGFFASGQLREGTPPGFGVTAGAVPAGTDLYRLLESGTSATPVRFSGEASGELLLTFEDTAGAWCRELRLTDRGDSVHAVACRRAGAWQVEVATFGRAAGTAPSGQYQAASRASPAAVDTVIDDLIGDNEPLDPDAERRLLRSGWEKKPQPTE